MKQYRNNPYDRVYALIWLDRIRHNMQEMRRVIPKETQLCGVVKADAYGHGAPAVAKAIDAFVALYAVATVDEGILLRKHGVTKPILVLGVTPDRRVQDLLRFGIMPTIFTEAQAKVLAEQAEWTGVPVPVHFAVDTGMGRIGFAAESEEALEEAVRIAQLPMIRVDGIFTHFATADEADKTMTMQQLARFTAFTEALEQKGVHPRVKHCANSAGIVEGIGQNFDLMRAGITLYGVYPSEEVRHDTLSLQPAMELKAKVSFVKVVEKGATISYGADFCAPSKMEVATIPVGYADGYPRALSGKGAVLLHGKRCPILGRVCMDQFMVDVSGLGVQVGDEATLLGRDGAAELTLQDFEAAGCFSYEVLCNIGKRVPRVYMDEGAIVGLKDDNDEMYADFL